MILATLKLPSASLIFKNNADLEGCRVSINKLLELMFLFL
jgi:hypothetical protein